MNNDINTQVTQYVDEFGNPIDPSLIDENGNYIGQTVTQYVDEQGNPIDPSLIDENGNYIGNMNTNENVPTIDIPNNQNAVKEGLGEVTNITEPTTNVTKKKNDSNGLVTYDYNSSPITDIVNSIIMDGITSGASDIHFDPFDNGIKIRIRIDGELNDYSIVPLYVKKNMITRLKIISGMNITESRTPQDGAIRSEANGKSIDLRVSCLPTNMGEKIVVRIMDYSMSAEGIESLDFNERNLEKVNKMLSLPNGIILVTGATGSGKSTTVYSMLQKLNTEDTNLITVEDPIELNIDGINQVQAVSEIGLTFASALRSILRQDPDVIMIGEIRDDETARIAVRASITGHLVLSTIHTNNSLNTIERLTDMSVERYLLGSALSGIISQKLARRLCPKCKRLRKTTDYEKDIFKRALNKDVDEMYEAVGCPECSKGYRGRIAIQEVLLVNQEIKDAINKNMEKKLLRELVYGKDGTETMLSDGLEKVLDGKTSFDEIIKLIDLDDDLGKGSELGLASQIEESQMNNDDGKIVSEEKVQNATDITENVISEETKIEEKTPEINNSDNNLNETDKISNNENIINEDIELPEEKEEIKNDELLIDENKENIIEEQPVPDEKINIESPSNSKENETITNDEIELNSDNEIDLNIDYDLNEEDLDVVEEQEDVTDDTQDNQDNLFVDLD